MVSKATLIDSVKAETKILKHLLTQVPANGWDYRPSAPQRSTLELVRYLAYLEAAATDYALTGTWDGWEKLEAASKEWQAPDLPKALDRQLALVKKSLAKVTDRAVATKKIKMWSGEKITLGDGLINMVIKPAAAYRMQLFLYLKAAGATHLTSSDLWQGKAAKAKKTAAAASA